MKQNYVFGALAALMIGGMATPGAAAIIAYSDRTSWQAAAGSITGAEDFNGFTTDEVFVAGAPVALSDGMAIGQLQDNTSIGRIDALPTENDFETDVDGTPGADLFNANAPFITFTVPITAFGADLASIQDDVIRTGIEIYLGGNLLATLTPPMVTGQTDQFWGFVASAGELIDEIRFVENPNLFGDTFGLDNIEIVAAAQPDDIPEPAALGLLGVGLFGLSLLSRLRRR